MKCRDPRSRSWLAPLAAILAAVTLSAPAQAAPNGKLAFERLSDIYLVNPDGTNITNLTASRDFEEQAQFSPDGTKLAFVRAPVQDRFLNSGKDDVWVMNADGSNPVKITNVADRIESLRWSGDGTRLLYWADRDATGIIAELYAVAADGSTETMLTADGPPIDEGGLGLSTAGDKVAYALSESFGQSDVFVSKLDGTGLTQVTNSPGVDFDPVLTPDATRVAWSSGRDHPSGGTDIYSANLDGSLITRVTTTAGGATNFPAAFSADGARLGYDRASHASLINADGTAPVALTTETTFDFFEEFAPDGSRVVYSHVRPIRGEDPHYTIDTVLPDGSGHQVLVGKAADPVYMDWQPATPAPNPVFALSATAREEQKAASVRMAFECSNECEVDLRATGRAGGERFESKKKASGWGNVRTETTVLSKAARREIKDGRGKMTIVVRARDQFGGTQSETLEVTLTR